MKYFVQLHPSRKPITLLDYDTQIILEESGSII